MVVLACVFFFLATIPYQIGTRCRDDATRMCATLCMPLQTRRRRGSLCYHTHTPTTHPPTPNTPKKGKLMEALSTRSRSYYRSMYFRPVRGTEHILILGRVTYTVLAR